MAVVGSSATFTVTTFGTPLPTIKAKGRLPRGISFVDNHDGTASLSGIALSRTGRIYAPTIVATFGIGKAKQVVTQSFILTVDEAATITSGTSKGATEGVPFTFIVKTRGYPIPSPITESGALPAGVSFVDSGLGTATLAGTPATGTAGTYSLTIAASNGVGAPASQSFTLTVRR
jgi:hypothetical protein